MTISDTQALLSTDSSSASPIESDPDDRLWHTSVGDDPAFLLARANALSLQRMHDVLKPFDLQARSYSVLAIAASGARPSQRELSDFLQLDPSQIVSLLDRLQDRGLIVREPDPNDRRAKVIIATPKGMELAAEARSRVVASDKEWFERLPETDRNRFFEMLQLLAAPRARD